MGEKPTVESMMAAYAADAVDHARANFGIVLDYSSDSIERVEQILKRLHDSIPRGLRRFVKAGPSDEALEAVSKMYGGYLGEVFRRIHGGSWEIREDIPGATGPLITLTQSGGDSFFPASKVFKRLKDGEGDNVWFYYQVLSGRTTRPSS